MAAGSLADFALQGERTLPQWLENPEGPAAVIAATVLDLALDGFDRLRDNRAERLLEEAAQRTEPDDHDAKADTTKIRFFIKDRLGNVRVAYTAWRDTVFCLGWTKVVTLTDYFAYGKALRFWQDTATLGTRWQSTLHERDLETGWDFRGARMYNADLGRFLSLDPMMGYYPGWSPYHYVLGDPTGYTDPTGMCPDCPEGWSYDEYGDANYSTPIIEITASASNRNPSRESHRVHSISFINDANNGVRFMVGNQHYYRREKDGMETETFRWDARTEAWSLTYDEGAARRKEVRDRVAAAEDFEAFWGWTMTAATSVIGGGGAAPVAAARNAYQAARNGFNAAGRLFSRVLGRGAGKGAQYGETVSGILRPGGNLIGNAGSSESIREISGGIEAAQSYWDRLIANGATPVMGSSYKGTLMHLPEGGTIGFRTMMSRSPGTSATIDVNIPGLFQGKLKFNP